MTPDRWNRMQALFHEALGAPAPHVRLDEEADPEIRAAARRLLDAHRDAGSFIERPALLDYEGADPGAPAPEATGKDTGKEDAAENDGAFAGQRVGPWRLVRRIGRGGMGDVFLAERADGAYDQRAALKLVRRGMDSEAVLARFRQERQILAGLEHPNVARLLDGGLAEGGPFGGRPYLALELVEGEPITAYCDARRLPVAERLALWIEVGEAVVAAHRRLVVHRDLKPSNVLVAEDAAGRPRVKLLDFGIAKLLDPDGAPEAPGGDGAPAEPLTRTGVRVLTPAYAAPEQVRGEAVTTATDVYGLGAVLYELLAGRRPVATAGRSAREVERAVLETEPLRPSTAATDASGEADGATPQALAAARHTEPQRLQKTLAGDLDAVCLKALRKEPASRYAGADQFVEDVKRYLEGLPIAARRGSRAYRARKFIGRHQTGIAATALVSVALAIGLAAALWQSAEAQTQRTRSDRIATFMMELFESPDPYAADSTWGPDITVRSFLDQGLERVLQGLQNEPELRTDLLEVIARVYASLEDYSQTRDLAEEIHLIRKTQLGPEHPKTIRSLGLLGVSEIRTYDTLGVARLRERLDISRATLDPHSPDLAVALNDLGHSLAFLYPMRGSPADLHEAMSLTEEALSIYRILDEPNYLSDKLQVLENLAMIYCELDESTACVNTYKNILDVVSDIPNFESNRIGIIYSNLAIHSLDDAESIDYSYKALSLIDSHLIATNRRIEDNLWRRYAAIGDYDKAASLLYPGINAHDELSWQYLANFASLLVEQEAYKFAASTLIEANKMLLHKKPWTYAASHSATLHLDLSRVRLAQGRFQDAIDLGREALDINELDPSKSDGIEFRAKAAIGLAMARLNCEGKALQHLESALDFFQSRGIPLSGNIEATLETCERGDSNFDEIKNLKITRYKSY